MHYYLTEDSTYFRISNFRENPNYSILQNHRTVRPLEYGTEALVMLVIG